MDQRAKQLAHYLQGLGVGSDTLVGLYMERSLELVVALLAILKAGGAYVPIDPNSPAKRLTFMLQDAHVSVLLTQRQLIHTLPPLEAHVFCLDSDWVQVIQESQQTPTSNVTGDNLAYVIYTSGSTGLPKGVIVSHFNVMRPLLPLMHGITSIKTTYGRFFILMPSTFLSGNSGVLCSTVVGWSLFLISSVDHLRCSIICCVPSMSPY